MSRYSTSHSYNHKCNKFGMDWYRISWTWDRYYTGSRLRHPQSCSRDTDEKGARKFCKKWNIAFPGDK